MSSPTEPPDPNDPNDPNDDPNDSRADLSDSLGTRQTAPDSSPASPLSESSSTVPFDGTIRSRNSFADAEAPTLGPGYPQMPPLDWQSFDGRSTRFLDPDLRVPWGWLDLLLLAIVYIGATVISTILLAIFFASRGIQWNAIQHSPRAFGFFVVAGQIFIYIALFLYLWLQARVRFHAPFWSTFGWHKLEPSRWPRPIAWLGFIALGFVLSASVQLVSVAFPPKTKLPIETLMQNRDAALALMAMSVLLAPVVEETIFRGFLYPVAARSFGVFAGIIVTGTIFGLLHAEQLWGGWAQISLLVVVGIVFTWVRAAKRTVLASYFLHVSYNFLIVLTGLRSLHR
ncbi:MAG: lysostaphin resistance A-like protein [Candidatus Acidiferrales bacterium]